MLNMRDYVAPNTLREAWSIYSTSPSNVILGGCAFLRLGSKKIGTGIDLCNLKLDYVKIHDTYIEIGAMTKLRTLETHMELKSRFQNVLGKSVESIVGVSFRNTATVGGSVFGRYGFSDINTALLSLNAEVELYKGGVVSLESYLNTPPHFDMLISIRIPQFREEHLKTNIMNGYHYEAVRISKGDFPVLTSSVVKDDEGFHIAIGARPMRAKLALKSMRYLNKQMKLVKHIDEQAIDQASLIAADELTFGSNMRGRAEYRKHLCRVMVKRALNEVLK